MTMHYLRSVRKCLSQFDKKASMPLLYNFRGSHSFGALSKPLASFWLFRFHYRNIQNNQKQFNLCCHIKNDVIDSIRLQFFSPQIFTAVKNTISHLKGHKICFLEKIKWSSWRLTTFQKKCSNQRNLVK